MPQGFDRPPAYLQSGNPETENTPTTHAPGQIGNRFNINNPGRQAPGTTDAGRSKRYQYVRTDSTMSVAPFPGAVAWWADQAQYLVTTVATNRNQIAGVFRTSVTPGYYCCVQIGGPCPVKVLDADVASLAIGESIIPSTTAGKATRVAVGTAPTHSLLGRVAGPPISTDILNATTVVNLMLPETT